MSYISCLIWYSQCAIKNIGSIWEFWSSGIELIFDPKPNLLGPNPRPEPGLEFKMGQNARLGTHHFFLSSPLIFGYRGPVFITLLPKHWSVSAHIWDINL